MHLYINVVELGSGFFFFLKVFVFCKVFWVKSDLKSVVIYPLKGLINLAFLLWRFYQTGTVRLLGHYWFFLRRLGRVVSLQAFVNFVCKLINLTVGISM